MSPHPSSLRVVHPDHDPTDPLDPLALGTLEVVPLVPEEVLARHKVLVTNDTRFRAAARLLQGLWRQDRELPIGAYVDSAGKRVRLGSRITESAGKAGSNFLTPDIARLVSRECVYREIGALIEIDRLRTNLLSSMPLVFNLFAPLKRDLRQATRFINEILPGVFDEVVTIRFEHSPGRGRAAYTDDFSALDLGIYGFSPDGKRVCVGFEIKYSEAGGEPLPSRFSDRQLAITADSGLYAHPGDPALFGFGLQQLTREANLCQSMLELGVVDEAIFILAGPRFNHQIAEMGEAFAQKLAEPAPGKARFHSLTLETLVEAFVAIGMIEHAQAFHRRYLDFHLVDGELELELEAPTSKSRKGRGKAQAKAASVASPAPQALPAP